jgi:hypothetical protein
MNTYPNKKKGEWEERWREGNTGEVKNFKG